VYRPNWIEIDGVVNMRDLGGMPTTDGGSVRPRRLIRSDNLQDLPAPSVRHLVDVVGVRDVVDLRTHVEVAKEGEGPLLAEPAIRYHHFTLYREDTSESGIPAAERALPWETDERRARDTARREAAERAGAGIASAAEAEQEEARRRSHDAFWSEHYLSYLVQRPDSVVAALRAVAGSDGASIVHCAAGKDRTGTVVGLALTVVGVPADLVVADYAASAERVAAIMDRLRAKQAYADNLRDKTVAQQSPTTDTMRLLLEALQVRYGGALGWLEAQGWTAADTERLRARLLED
jgi:protein tyrosine/serine phosphatase